MTSFVSVGDNSSKVTVRDQPTESVNEYLGLYATVESSFVKSGSIAIVKLWNGFELHWRERGEDAELSKFLLLSKRIPPETNG